MDLIEDEDEDEEEQQLPPGKKAKRQVATGTPFCPIKLCSILIWIQKKIPLSIRNMQSIRVANNATLRRMV